MIRIENTQPGHSKFWAGGVNGSTVVTWWGRIGCRRAASKVYEFATAEDASSFLSRRASRKLQRGYRLVTAS